MLPPFQSLSPEWNIPSVKACTLLANDLTGNPVSFSQHTSLGLECRDRLETMLGPISWIRQVHGETMVELPVEGRPEADACFTLRKNTVCAVLTADCLPVVFARNDGSAVAVVHAGRKGIELGLLPKMVHQLGSPSSLMVWIGPGIAAESYPVSAEMRAHFLSIHPDWPHVFEERSSGQFHMDLYQIARLQLLNSGVPSEQISGAQWNTFTDPLLHSARRDGAYSGRLVTLAWLE